MYDVILVPTDGSDAAEGAARHALDLASAFGSEVHFLSVVEERSHGRLVEADPSVEDVGAALERQAREAVEDLAALASDASVTSHVAVERGTPYEALRSYADEHGADLVAMGTHGRTGLERLLLGSLTGRVVRTSDVPVLTARHGPDGAGYDRILVPTDGSDAATAAVEHAVAIADRYGATVHALSVVEPDPLAGVREVGADFPEVVERREEACERAVAAVAGDCEARGVDAVTDVVLGTPFRAIQDYVDEEGIDLVAMGTRGRTGVERYLLGSVTERTVRASDVPVLAVR